MTDLRQQAEALYGREQEELRRREQRERESQKEQGIRSHIGRIQQQRNEERKEQARKEAAAEAEELAAELHQQGEMLQDHAEGMRSMIEDYAELRDRLMAARRRSGRELGGWEAGRHARARCLRPGFARSSAGMAHSSIYPASRLARPGRCGTRHPAPCPSAIPSLRLGRNQTIRRAR